MTDETHSIRCAIYTRKSSTNRLDIEVNSLLTQREVCSAYITSQAYKSWVELPTRYDDGGQSGSDLERPALVALMHEIEQGNVDTVVVYKIDRLTRSLVDFVRLIDLFEQRNITLVSISQAFDTSDSMGRMVLNILLTFSQFEREMIAERVRDSLRARKRHGKIHGGKPPFGYRIVDDELLIDEHEAEIVRFIFGEFLRTERYIAVQRAVEQQGYVSSVKSLRKGGSRGGTPISSSIVYAVLQNPIYIGKIKGHKSNYQGRHEPIISNSMWQAVQELTKARRKPKPNPKDTNHCLAGLLRDELGRTMYLDVQRKAGKTHIYYSSTDAQWSRTEYLRAYRTHAARFDSFVIAALAEFLCDRVSLRQALKILGVKADELEALAKAGKGAADRLTRTESGHLRELFEALFVGVEVGKEHVTFNVRSMELRRFLKWDDRSSFHSRPSDWALSDASYEFTVEVAVVSAEKWPALNLEARIGDVPRNPNKDLVTLIESAREAQRLVETHRDLSVPELAKKMRIRPSQFARFIRANYLAPDIATAILDGTQPEGLTRASLLRTNIPTDWALQRRLFGFARPQRAAQEKRGGGMW